MEGEVLGKSKGNEREESGRVEGKGEEKDKGKEKRAEVVAGRQ